MHTSLRILLVLRFFFVKHRPIAAWYTQHLLHIQCILYHTYVNCKQCYIFYEPENFSIACIPFLCFIFCILLIHLRCFYVFEKVSKATHLSLYRVTCIWTCFCRARIFFFLRVQFNNKNTEVLPERRIKERFQAVTAMQTKIFRPKKDGQPTRFCACD